MGFESEWYGSVSVIGRRKEMEDAVRVELEFVEKGGEKYDFYGVYDGHGGAAVARACRERLHEVVAEEVGGGGGWEKVMEESFGRMDEEVRGMDKVKTVGSTAVVAVVGKEEVVVANCGDSRAVISRGGHAVPMSNDHKPDRSDELKRVEDAGGIVINWDGNRVLGVLATSRSIGDEYMKPFVIAKPEVKVVKRSENDEFLILGSDGLWDVMSNELACKVVNKCLYSKKRSNGSTNTAEAAALLTRLALARGSRDNISVIVVQLQKDCTHYGSCDTRDDHSSIY